VNYREKNEIVNQIHAIRRELTTLENLVWSLHQEGNDAEEKPQERKKEEASGAQTPAPTQAPGKP
jgi:DNA-binding FrmR family transcriptional regulator